MKTEVHGNKITITAERKEETLAVSLIQKIAEDITFVCELANEKVKEADAAASDAQWCMDKANAEIADIKDKWWFKAAAYMGSCIENWKGGR